MINYEVRSSGTNLWIARFYYLYIFISYVTKLTFKHLCSMNTISRVLVFLGQFSDMAPDEIIVML